ncbi:MAG: hypothetical protein DRI23_12400 [Candidatus Cloacimonadota bacterium]|nr:MAG: hypothetical protein DRI23_12400 [Candidatus Cloacimonadota bacterium]
MVFIKYLPANPKKSGEALRVGKVTKPRRHQRKQGGGKSYFICIVAAFIQTSTDGDVKGKENKGLQISGALHLSIFRFF